MARTTKFIINNVLKRYPNIISASEAEDIIDAIEDYILYKFINNEQFSVDKFGTITPYNFHGHKAVGLDNREWYVEGFKHIKFIPSFLYKKILLRKKKELAKKDLTT